MSGPTREDALDHLIIVLFENRSFDNVLGHLYGPGDGKTFEGVIGNGGYNHLASSAIGRSADLCPASRQPATASGSTSPTVSPPCTRRSGRPRRFTGKQLFHPIEGTYAVDLDFSESFHLEDHVFLAGCGVAV